MLDQADALRTLFQDKAVCSAAAPRSSRAYTVAVTSGKGGVGKTSIAVNLAVLLSRLGRRVRLVDADFGLSNAEFMLGVAPKHNLEDVARGCIDARDAWVDAPGGIKLLSSGSAVQGMANVDGATGAELVGQVLDGVSDEEVVIVDTGPGISASVVSLLALADEVMVVTTPEPTSIADTYAAIKVLTSFCPNTQITLVANCCASPGQASSIATGLEQICLRFLERSFERHEYLPYDRDVSHAIQLQKPLVVSSPRSATVTWLRKIAIKLEDRVSKRRQNRQMRELPVESLGSAELTEVKVERAEVRA